MSSVTTRTISVQDIAIIVGTNEGHSDLRYLIKADEAAAGLMEAGEGVLLDDNSKHHEAFETLARASEYGSSLRAADEKLKAIDDVQVAAGGDADWATDVACDRWSPVIEQAYYVGLAMGLRLAGGAR